jgi:hypothetical protein
LELSGGDAVADDGLLPETAAAAAIVASFATATFAISIFFTLFALDGGFCTPPAFTGGEDEKCVIPRETGAAGDALRLAGGLKALNPLFGDPM